MHPSHRAPKKLKAEGPIGVDKSGIRTTESDFSGYSENIKMYICNNEMLICTE